MLHVYQSNRVDCLFDKLVQLFPTLQSGPFDEVWLAVPSVGMKEWLSRGMTEALGVWSGVRTVFPRHMVEHLLSLVQGEQGRVSRTYDPGNMVWAVMSILPTLAKTGEHQILSHYLDGDEDGSKLYQLAYRVARSFDEYTLYRPEMILAWELGKDDSWQAQLWRLLVGRLGGGHFAKALDSIGRAKKVENIADSGSPGLVVFGVSTMAPAHLAVLERAADFFDVHLMVHSPCKEYIGDLTAGEAEVLPGTATGILSAGGRELRDFQEMLIELSASPRARFYEIYREPSNLANSVLARVQSGVLSAGSMPCVEVGDESADVKVHLCHGPMREVEVLKDCLLRMFDEITPALLPEEVAVVAPDMDSYAPYVEAVFSSTSSREAHIPFRIEPPSFAHRAEPMATVRAIFEAASGRFSLNKGFDVLSRETVAGRFELTSAEVEKAQRLAAKAGVRWGAHEEHRERVGQPRRYENTWRFGMDRLMLGLALSDQELFQGIAPLGTEDEDAYRLAASVSAFAEKMIRLIDETAQPQTLHVWLSLVDWVVESFVDTSSVGDGGRQQLTRALDRLREGCLMGGLEERVSARVFNEILLDFTTGSKSGFPRGSGVTFCDFAAVRGVPYRVVCMLGMEEGAFPRRRSAPGFDLVHGSPRRGDRSLRDDDRAVFIEAIVGARERLHISCGVSKGGGDSRGVPSVVVSELLEAVGDDPASGSVIVKHESFPYSSKYFDGSSSDHFSYCGFALAGARASLGDGESAAVSEASPLTPGSGTQRIAEIELKELTSFFRSPSRSFVEKELGVRLLRIRQDESEREPIQPDSLELYLIGEEILGRFQEHGDEERAYEEVSAAGLLPGGAAGRMVFDEVAWFVRAATRALGQKGLNLSKGRRIPVGCHVSTSGGEYSVRGEIGGVLDDGRVLWRYGSLSPKHQLSAWIEHLVWGASSGEKRRTVLVGRESGKGVDTLTFGPAKGNPASILGELVELYVSSFSQPLPLFPDLSFEFANKRVERSSPDEAKFVEKASSSWRAKGGGFPGVARDPEEELAFHGRDPFSGQSEQGGGFAPVSRTVFDPMIAAVQREGGGE